MSLPTALSDRPRDHAAPVSCSTVDTLVRQTAADHYLTVPGEDRPVFEGVFDVTALEPGLIAHRIDVRDVQGSTVRATLKPALRLGFTIGGYANMAIACRALPTGPGRGAPITAWMMALHEPATFSRQSRRGDVERTVDLAFGATWLADHFGDDSAIVAFARTHLATRTWTPSAQALANVEQMLRPPALDAATTRLYLRSRAFDLLVEAASQLGQASDTSPQAGSGLGKRDWLRMRSVRDLLESGAADHMSLEQIALQACVSANTLQRHFRAAWGCTVFEFLREARMQRARVALERDGVTVAQAAWLAGYNSPANFATAFRRHYGVSPGQLRAHLGGAEAGAPGRSRSAGAGGAPA